jgi:exopolyphosphatase/guanosine-5'-triphosphate,3'-diphosphate pyrophosphatase
VRVAVVDIGTNSTRLLVADVGEDGVHELERESVVTRLGEGVDATGRLGKEPQERVFRVLGDYAAAIERHGAERRTAVMTSAVRDAANGAAFAGAVRERFGLDGRTLSGDEEARLRFLGATVAHPGARLLVIDIGGGSTELVIGSRGTVEFHTSTQAGVVRHTERHLRGDPPAAAELDALAADARAIVGAAAPQTRPPAAVAVAGTATQLASVDLRLERYDPARVEGHTLTRRRIADLRDDLAALPLEERRRVRGMHPDRAPTIVAGAIILGEVLDAFALDRVEVSDRDILWGVAMDATT